MEYGVSDLPNMPKFLDVSTMLNCIMRLSVKRIILLNT
jgi:hypothetical protein